MSVNLRNRLLVGLGSILMIVSFLSACKKGEGSTAKQTVAEKAKVEFYVMSQCPFGTQVEDAIAPVLKKFGGDVDFSIDFIGSEKDGTFTSMHGEREVNGDKVHACAIKHSPDKYMELITCMNKNARSIPDNWEDCAKQCGAPVDLIKTCYAGDEGKSLLKASFDKATARNARGSPTIFIGGKPYNGGRGDLAFSRAICDAFPKDKPGLCSSLPPPVKVPVTIVSDARCKDCRADFWQKRLESMFPGAEIKILDYGTEEGKKIYSDLKVTFLPAILFGKEVEKADDYARISRFLTPKGEYLEFQSGARFDPTKEICDNTTDDNNNGKVDCDDEDCKMAMECRKEIPKKLDLFVMSQCPFGVQAINAMKEVLDALSNQIQFEIHFIADEQDNGFKSLHGQAEVDENIRELCVMKNYGKNYKWMEYLLCRNKNIKDANWQSCTGGTTGFDTKKIETCSAGEEGKKLLKEDIKIAQALAVTGSPTWLANNKKKFSGLDAESVKNNICQSNQGLKGCEKKLSGPPQQQGGAPTPSCN
jgi:2-hydroxychromene-2-carboxylate isomerase